MKASVIGSDHPAADLVELDRFEQGLEIALAEAFVALALDNLEENRADDVLGKDLQQQSLALGRRAIEEDAALVEFGGRLAMARDARVEQLVIGLRRVLELDPACPQDVDRRINVIRAKRDVLDPLA